MITSRLPEIAAGLAHRMDTVASNAADKVVEGAQERVPVKTSRLHDAIHKEHTGLGEYTVLAGDTEVFYGHIVEHGGARTPPHPFLMPAAEDVHNQINSLGLEAFGEL